MTQRFITLAVAVAGTLLAQNVNPKGIFVTGPGAGSGTGPGAPANRPAVRYSIKLMQNGEVRPVAASYQFQDGDRFRFLFEVSQSSYVYLLHRQLEGNPDTMESYTGAKGIITVRDDDNRGRAPGNYTLLYPTSGNVRLTAHEPRTIPADSSYFQFDSKPGLEKIVLVVSSQPLEIGRQFNLSGNAPRAGGARNDSDNDVLGQLKKDIEAMDRNTVTVTDESSSKGICVGDCSGYSAPRNPAKPFLVNIDLRHFRRGSN